MNSLSWLIYLAGVAGNLAGFLVFITVVLGVLALISGIIALAHMDERLGYRLLEGQELENCRKTKRWAFKVMAALFFAMIIMGSVAAMIPNRQTVLLIAASEIGERVITHQRVQEVVDPSVTLLQTWIQQQTQQIQQQMNGSRR